MELGTGIALLLAGIVVLIAGSWVDHRRFFMKPRPPKTDVDAE